MPDRIEKIIANAVGAAEGNKPDRTGMSGVFKKLAEEHAELTLLMRYVAESSDKERRRDLYPEIRRQILAHECGELQEIYPALAIYDGLRTMAASHAEDSLELATVIKSLDSLAIDGERWAQEFQILMELVDRHAYQEENEFFPEALDRLGNEEAKRLERYYESAKRDALNQLD